MAQTSIHFQAVKGGSEEHNKRTKKLDYVHHELSSQNDYWQSDTQEARLAFVTQNAKAKTGRKMQAKATPIREAVVVIEDTTTMDDLKKLAKRFNDRFGIDVFQIAIHKDEGYKKSKDGIKLNLHAHLVADWTDHESGKSLKLNRNDMAEMQTICAEVLGMERGKSSEKQHLSAIQYKIAAEEQRAEAIESKTRGLGIIQKNLSNDISDLLVEVKTKSKECDRLALSAKNMGRILEYNTEEAKKKALINERLSEEGKSLREEKERLRNDILGLTTQKEEIGSEAESLADVVQAARSDLFHLNAQKIAVSGEILNLNQERDKAQREAEEAKAQKRTAEAEAAKGLAIGAAKKLGNVLGFGSEAKQLKELPQKLEEARTEGEKAAVTKILDVARLNFGDKEVTPEMIGKAWRSKWDEAKNARAETERQVKNATAHASGLEKILDAFLAIPIIRACVHAIVSFVRQGRRSFSTEDTAILKTALGGDPDNAAALRKIAYYHGGAYAQPHLSSYWDRAEMCMQKIARGENQEQDQNISQGRRWHL
ncbi:hypothetical protein [Segatella copri]|jgi:hypothetical protein|uniref:Mobilization protein n=1 Tax=Segatella copri TaxID=165179 RepID=A0A3R6KKL7_9BACT|nr:hypothetical protein [Segatella copri]RHG29163.1 hypothetical protein DW263_15985 [Segatella copri]RHG31160.1 hypothetical protein DW262_15455 [Segatella copri]RHG60994.1 hypothetical protein DW250_15655 [Segatella copri]